MADQKKIPPIFQNVTEDVEYSVLREEFLKRLDVRYQLINYVLVAFAALLGVGFQTNDSTSALIVLIYPFVATGLAVAWVDNHYRSRLIIIYIRARAGRWEMEFQNYLKNYGGTPWKERLGALSIATIFPGTQLLALAAAVYLQITKGTSLFAFFASLLSCLALIFTLVLLSAGYSDKQISNNDITQI